jgi:hypothetical protein
VIQLIIIEALNIRDRIIYPKMSSIQQHPRPGLNLLLPEVLKVESSCSPIPSLIEPLIVLVSQWLGKNLLRSPFPLHLFQKMDKEKRIGHVPIL